MIRTLGAVGLLALTLVADAYAQSRQRSQQTPAAPSSPSTPAQPPAQQPAPPRQEQAPPPATQPAPAPPQHPEEAPASEPGGERQVRPMHYDMTEAPPVVTHHEIRLNGQTLHYTATAGRLPINDNEGKTQALMFYVAYTLDGATPGTRPLTFAYNGGPGSASIWLHMGALGPRTVVLQPEGWIPESPYRLADNSETPLDKTDLVLIDAIGTGFSRPADAAAARRYWNVRGDIQAFAEFIRMYLNRNQRWASPLYLFGESYGTTRSAGLAGYLNDRGINFNGIVLLSTVLNFESLEFAKTNDVPYPLILPSYAMIAAYHHKLEPELMRDLERTRQEVEQFATGEYSTALNKGDALSPQERQAVIDKLARYTGLSKQIIDLANLRVDVRTFTHWLLADQKLRVGRLDGRFTGPDPNGFMDTRFYDPSGDEIAPAFNSVFQQYLREELNYKTDMPYWVSADSSGNFVWNWTPAGSEPGYPDTATALRQAMVKDRYLKVLVMEAYYDLATPFFAANYTMDHLDLPPDYRKSISYATYESGHMVYLETKSHAKLKRDFAAFLDSTAKHGD